jgi:hypothetical protein
MDDDSIRASERTTRVQTFGRDNSADITPASRLAALLVDLDPIAEKLTAARVGQLREPVGKQVLLDALSEDFKDIARTSRAIVLDEPDFPVAAYRHPGKYTEEPITTHAGALLQLLEDQATDTPEQTTAKAALRAKFIGYEIPADFVEDLRADSYALDDCNAAKYSDNHEGVESTSAIDTLLAEAKAIVTRLDAAFLNKYKSAWKSASRIERAPRKSKVTEDPVMPPAQ